MSEQKKRGGARENAGRKTKAPYTRRKTGAWNVEAWIPPALQELSKEKGLKSASDIVNEALKSLCYLFGKRNPDRLSTDDVDPFKTARWRFFSDEELEEVVAAIRERYNSQGSPKSGPLKSVWMSSWEALEPPAGKVSWRHSVLDEKKDKFENH